jgi:Variant SH3 domain
MPAAAGSRRRPLMAYGAPSTIRGQDTTQTGVQLVRDQLVTVLRHDRDSGLSEVVADDGRRGWIYTQYIQATC